MIVRYKNNFIKSDIWESGWNIFSLESVKKIIKKEISNFEYKKFNISTDLPKQGNPVSTYTVDLKNDDKLILTGAGIVRNFYLLSFTKEY